MSVEATSADARRALPSAWSQFCPRSVRLAPDGLFVPAGALRALLRNGGRLRVLYSGLALLPWIRNGATLSLDGAKPVRAGDLALFDIEGWGDIRRCLRRLPGGDWITGLDGCPGARDPVEATRILATVVGRIGAGGATGRVMAAMFPIGSRLAAVLYWIDKGLEAPDFGDQAAASVQRKYASQVESYNRMLGDPFRPELRALLVGAFPPGGSILVAGCGAGGEVIHLARAGFRVTGFDVLRDMVRAARGNAAAAGVAVELLTAEMADLDLPGRTFDGIYVTPDVYSFVPGRERRVQSLRRLGRHLAPGGVLIYSAQTFRSLSQVMHAALAWARHLSGSGEFGDWFTWFLLPDGTIGKSFTHLFAPSRVIREARQAGFRTCTKDGAYFIARDFG